MLDVVKQNQLHSVMNHERNAKQIMIMIYASEYF